MLTLQVIALFLAWASATYGIWSSKKLDRKKAWIATVITSLGLITGSALAVTGFLAQNEAKVEAEAQQEILRTELSGLNEKYTDQKNLAETLLHQLRLALTGTKLTDLEVRWVFRDVPPRVLDVFALGNCMASDDLMADDEMGRLADWLLSRILDAWHVENVLVPLIAIISTGKTDLDEIFEGDISAAISAFGADASDVADPDELWCSIEYKGPTYQIVFPLNSDHSAALSLGKKADDQIWEVDDSREGLDGYLHKLLNYGFEAEACRVGSGFALRWRYDSESLARASVDDSQGVTAAFPVEFHFLSRERESYDYIESLRDEPLDRPSEDDSPVDKWLERSEMTIVTNGIEEAATKYAVRRIGRRDRILEFTKYDAPEKQYEYVLFTARRMYSAWFGSASASASR